MKRFSFAAALAAATALGGAAMAQTANSDTGAGATGTTGIQSGTTAGSSAGGTMGNTDTTGTSGTSASGMSGQSAGLSGENLSEDEIRRLQQALRDSGQDVEVDGVWGENTTQALRSYQQENDLTGSGELDQQTLARLGVSIDPQQAQTPDMGTGTGSGDSDVQRSPDMGTGTTGSGGTTGGAMDNTGGAGDLGTGGTTGGSAN